MLYLSLPTAFHLTPAECRGGPARARRGHGLVVCAGGGGGGGRLVLVGVGVG